MPALIHSKTNPLYRPDIDGLRAIAVLGVVAYHIGTPGITGGFVGVDVFFVISGYLITQLLVRQIDATGHLSLTDFYARRIRRLLPALGIVILATLVLGLFVLPPMGDRRQLGESALSSLIFVANQFFLVNTDGYFDGPSELKPLLHLWSLSVEEQFYIVWPITLIAVTHLVPATARLRWFRLTIGAITLSSFAFSVWLVHSNASMAFFISPSRAWELGTGALLSLWSPSQGPGIMRVGRAAAWLGTLLILSAYTLIEPSTRFPGLAALLPVLGTALIIYGNSVCSDSVIARLLKTGPMVGIGAVSYGWYLWHWPLLSFARHERLMAPNFAVDAALVLLALGLSALTLKYLENPIRYGTKLRRLDNAAVLRAGGASILALSLVAASLLIWDAYGPKSAREQLASRIAADRPDQVIDDCLIHTNRSRGHLPADACRFGAQGQSVAVALWGDSHAMAWAPMVQALQQNELPAFYLFSMSSCQPLLTSARNAAIASVNTNCIDFNQRVLKRVIELKSKGLTGVILSARWVVLRHPSISYYDHPQERAGLRGWIRRRRALDRQNSTAQAVVADPLPAGLSATFEALRDAGLRVLVLLDPPEVAQPIAACMYVRYEQPLRCGIARADYDRNTGDVVATIKSIAAQFPSVRVIDPVDRFCNAKNCPPLSNGSPMLWDDDHISTSAARALAPSIREDFRWVLGK